jgi:hypothetical protein
VPAADVRAAEEGAPGAGDGAPPDKTAAAAAAAEKDLVSPLPPPVARSTDAAEGRTGAINGLASKGSEEGEKGGEEAGAARPSLFKSAMAMFQHKAGKQ